VIVELPSSPSYDIFPSLSTHFLIVNPAASESLMQAISSKAISHTFSCRHLQKSHSYPDFQSWEQITSEAPAPKELDNHQRKFRRTLQKIFLKKGDKE